MKITSVLAAATLAMASTTFGQSTCNEWSPCYREGYCNVDASFCLWGLCDESKSYNSTSCWKPEGCTSQVVNFHETSDIIPIGSYAGNPETNAFLSIFEPDNTRIGSGNLELRMKYDPSTKKGFGATAKSSHTIQYGRVTARVKSGSLAKGVVTSFIIINEQTGDEIDFEWVGLNPDQVQTNFYYRGVLDYTKMLPANVGSDSSAAYHDYTIDWSEDKIVWLVDNKPIRTLNRADTYDASKGVYAFPTSEGRIALSIWDGGNSGQQGTQEWAGYPTPWSADTVYKAFFDSVTIECSGDSTPSSSDDAGSEEPSHTGKDEETNTSDAGNEAPTNVPENPKCIPRPLA
ncbi:hypothetical protein COEREDRAFT_83416 [Coemansia reversa NRRL 1564]|uniref:GH16 domain-containing protein n=1 Tax=Coemansia reversa (strain ATCC 12441 / NRRL 1564) TaxID=763665 RepID=A0A2G5B3H1_COERN|nr:hypothetical protein COEREDRAFT_83416 [Coemansia reversa NRRL 1564]|eukprot:PIA13558.1 hypothetical protein COEREDRAFT_83416 [Coemansia reversa NRRL 1564]